MGADIAGVTEMEWRWLPLGSRNLSQDRGLLATCNYEGYFIWTKASICGVCNNISLAFIGLLYINCQYRSSLSYVPCAYHAPCVLFLVRRYHLREARI